MKRFLCIILVFIIAAAFMPTVIFAQSGLSIDSSKVYDGMDKSYSQGYMPRVKNGYAYIVLPLVGDTVGDVITVTPQLETDGPFVYGNYIFNVKKANGVYLVKLNLPLKADRQNGLYPVTFNVSYDMKQTQPQDGEQAEAMEMQQSFTVYVSITDGEEPSPAAELFITGYKTNPSVVKAGNEFTAELTIKNIGSSKADNIRLTYDGTESEFGRTIIPKEVLNTLRIDSIGAGAERNVKFVMKVSKDAPTGTHSFMVHITYTDGELSQVLTADVTQPNTPKEPAADAELFITGYKVAPATVKSGADFTVNLTIKNIGESPAEKIRLTYEGNDEETISPKNALNIIRVDDIKAGRESSVKFTMTVSKDAESGKHGFMVSITYKGGELSQRFTVAVLQPNQPKPEKEKQPAELFITDYKVSPKQVNGGDDFDVTVTIKNIGGSAAEKIRLTYDGAEGESGKVITPKTALNIIRVANMKAGAEKKIKFTMTASKDAVAGKQSFSVAITYSGGELMQMLNVNVIQPLDVSVDEIQMPQEVVSGESVMIPISILNKGKSAIYDVTAKLEMDGCYGSSVYIGEVQAGTTGYAEMKVFIGTLSQGGLYGGTFGSLNITYKEADGSEYTDTTELRTTITEPQSEDESKADTDEEQPKLQPVSQWYISVIVGIAVIAIAVAVIIVVSYQRKLRLK